MSAPPSTLGRYRVVEVLGRGGMALVYRGQDEELDRPVAIKVLADNLAADDSFRQRFLREAQLAARLTHRNIVHVYDAGETDGRPYIVMEYVEGETLADFIARRGKLPPGEAVELVLQVCAGLGHAHEAGLVHRDIKPQNVLIATDDTAKIADFGIARSAHGTQITEVGVVLGTAPYLAPEQAAGEEVTPAADIYAIGVVLYELLTGRTPYTIESLRELLVHHQEQPIRHLRELVPEVSPSLEEVVMRCLAYIPTYRPHSTAALASALRETIAELPTRPLQARTLEVDHASAPTPSRRATRPYTRRHQRGSRASAFVGRRRALAATIAATAALLGIGAVALGDDGSRPPRKPTLPAPPTPAQQAHDLSDWLRAHSR